MSCRKTRLKRGFVPYLEGPLSARRAARLEKHLLACGDCRAELERLRSGFDAAQRLRPGSEAADRPSPGIAELLAGPSEPSSGIGGWVRRWEIRFAALTTPRAVLILAVAVVVLLVILGLLSRGLIPGRRASFSTGEAAAGTYHSLTVSEVAANTRPRIAVEGFVREVRFDQEERILRFKLVEKPDAAEPYVICEILDPARTIVPREGSLVRVYGVARYDAQPGRGWHEINPVLNMSVIKD